MARQHILILEPEAMLRNAVANRMLYPCGYNVSMADSQDEGLKTVQIQNPDLLMLHLPLDEVERFLNTLDRINKNIPTILIVERETVHIPIQFLHLGVKDFIVLPLLPITVQQAVERVLDQSQYEAPEIVDNLDRINRELEQRLKEYDRLFKINHSIFNSPDADVILCRSIEAAIFVTNADEATLMLLDEKSNTWFIRSKMDASQKQAQILNQPANGNLVKQAIYSSRSVLQNGIHSSSPTISILHSRLDIPLKNLNKVVGVLGVKNFLPEKKFSPAHTYQLTILAKTIMAALERANHRVETQITLSENVNK